MNREVLNGFGQAQQSRESMQAITLDARGSEVFARAALTLVRRPAKPAPITETQILMPRPHGRRPPRPVERFNRTQENLIRAACAPAAPTDAARARGPCGH